MEEKIKKDFKTKDVGVPGISLIYLIVGFLAFVIFLVIVEVNFTWLRPFARDLRGELIEFELLQAKRVTDKIENLLYRQIEGIEYLAQNTTLIGRGGKETDCYIQSFLKENPAVEEVSLVGLDGFELQRYSRREYFSEGDLRDFSYLEEFETAKAGKNYISRVAFSVYAEPLIVLTVPVRIFKIDNSRMVLRAVVSLRKLWAEPLETRIGETGRISVVDDKGMLVADPNPSRVLKKTNLLHSPPVVDILLGKVAGGSVYFTEEGREVVGVGVPIGTLRWGVLVEQDLSEMETPLVGLERRMYLYFLGAILIIVILAWLLINLRNADKEIIIRREREKLVDQMKSEFISVAAHQLRTPLSAVKWILKMSMDGDFGAIGKKLKLYITKAYASNQRMIMLVNDLLDVSRMEEGKFGFEFGVHNFNAFVEEVVDYFQEAAALGDIDLRVSVPVRTVNLSFDLQKLKMVFSNLLDNAIRYTPKKGKVEVILEEKSDFVEVAIKDTGVGIPKHQYDRIFTKFFRADNVMRMQTEGSGLGLYLVKNIVQSHGGKIWFESEEGKGTTFHVLLPKKP